MAHAHAQDIKLTEARVKIADEDWNERVAGLQLLTELPPDVVAKHMSEKVAWLAIADPDALVRANAAKCLQALGSDDASRKHFAAMIGEGLDDPSRHVRSQAAEALHFFGVDAVDHAAALAGLLGDKASVVRRAAASTIGELGSLAEEHVQKLVLALSDYESEVRRGAVRGIGALGPAAAEHIDKVAELLHDVAYPVRRDAATALASLGEEASAHGMLLVALTLKDQNAEVRCAAASALKHLERCSREALCIDELAAALQHEELQVRLHAAQALQAQGEAASPKAKDVVGSLRDVDAEVRETTAAVFERMDAEMAAAFAAQLADAILEDDCMEVQHAAGRALAALPSAAGLPQQDRFAEALSAEATSVRLGGTLGLRALGAAVAPQAPNLVKALQDESWFVRRTAAESLGAMGATAAPYAEALLDAALRDSDHDVRRAAVEAFVAQGAEALKHVDKIAELASAEETKVGVRSAAGLALGTFGEASRPHLDKLRSMMRARESELRHTAAVAYGGLGGIVDDEDRHLLEACTLRDPFDSIRRAAHETLDRLGFVH